VAAGAVAEHAGDLGVRVGHGALGEVHGDEDKVTRVLACLAAALRLSSRGLDSQNFASWSNHHHQSFLLIMPAQLLATRSP
jgi:hypothetical protein